MASAWMPTPSAALLAKEGLVVTPGQIEVVALANTLLGPTPLVGTACPS